MSAQALQEFFVSLGFEVDTTKISEFEQQTARLREGVLKVGTVMTGAAVGIGAMVLKVAEGMDDVGDFADIIGMSAREVDALGKVAKQNDSSFDAMKSTLQGLSEVTGEAAMGLGRGAMIFEKLGLSAKDAEGKTKGAYDMLGEVADRMKGMADGDRLALASKLHIDPSLIPLLSKGSEAFREMKENAEAANPLTEEQYKQADAIVKAWGKATAYAGGYVKLLAAKLFPVMLSILKTYNDWVSTVKNGGAGAVSDAFRMAAAFAETLWDWIMRVAGGVKSAFSELKEFKIVVWAAGVAVAALIAYQAGVFFTTLGGAVMTAAKALFTFNASAALPVILVGGLVILIGLLVDELVNFYEGNETVIGQLNEKYPGAIYGVWAALVALGGGFIALKWKAIASMVETMAIMAMYAAEWIAAHAAMAVGALAAYWPILLIIGAIAAVVGGVWYLWENWGAVTKLLGDAWNVVTDTVKNAFAGALEIIDQVKAKVMGFIDTITGAIGKVGQLLGLTDSSSSFKVAMQSAGAAGTSPMAGAGAMGSSGGVIGSGASMSSNNATSTQTVTIGAPNITINSPDPAKAGESVRQELDRMNKQATRNGQSAVAL